MKTFLRTGLCLAVAIGACQFWRSEAQSQTQARDGFRVLDGTWIPGQEEADLAILPPAPDLRPESQKTLQERKAARKRASAPERDDPGLQSAPAGRTKEEVLAQGDRELLSRLAAARVAPGSGQTAAAAELMTASGRRLQSFDNPAFWQDPGAPDVEPDFGLGPMPDLRTPDQKTRWELKAERNSKIAEVKARRAEAIAELEEQNRLGQEAARQKVLEAASRPAPPQPVYQPYDGDILVVPETPTGKILVPYGEKSRIIQNDRVVNPGAGETRGRFSLRGRR